MLAAICCQGADALALVDVETGADRGTIPVGRDPVHAHVVDGRVLVATMGERAVTVVDTDGSVRTVETGVLGPSHFAASGERVFVPCTAGDVVAVFDRAVTALESRIPVGAEPHEIDVCAGTGFVGSRRDGSVTVFDAATGSVRGRLALAGDARVQGVAAVEDGERTLVYAVDQRNASIVRFDVGGPDQSLPAAPAAAATVGADPYDLSILDGRLCVPGRGDGTVHELTAALEVAAVHDVGGRPTDVVGRRRWVVDRTRPRFRSLAGDGIDVPHPSIVATPAGDDRYVLSHYDDAAVSLVDATAGRVVWTCDTPANPFGAVIV
ncbi:YncE family protein [Natrononativus amylolyticus]|uniref:YncE family protein n=1 Tax=Natrononativus amylolyticus TaxID=2963434 RepID=UPI0020CD8BAB|nr:hypothetical protein [Natrononativus amylolyticus]